jgi:hypothetical protein
MQDFNQLHKILLRLCLQFAMTIQQCSTLIVMSVATKIKARLHTLRNMQSGRFTFNATKVEPAPNKEN